MLWVGTGNDSINKAVSIPQARQLTCCEEEQAITVSTKQYTFFEKDCLLSVRINRQ
jgi:hypothetical protein